MPKLPSAVRYFKSGQKFSGKQRLSDNLSITRFHILCINLEAFPKYKSSLPVSTSQTCLLFQHHKHPNLSCLPASPARLPSTLLTGRELTTAQTGIVITSSARSQNFLRSPPKHLPTKSLVIHHFNLSSSLKSLYLQRLILQPKKPKNSRPLPLK